MAGDEAAAEPLGGHKVASVLSFLILFINSASALNPNQMQALDQLIAERRTAASKLAVPVRDATLRLDTFEKRMLPVVFQFNRLGPLVIQRNAELDTVKIYIDDPSSMANPYDDTAWIEVARKETAYVCCDVRSNQRLAQEIQENLARGLPALSESTAANVAQRARAAAQRSAGVTFDDGGDTPAPSGVPQSKPNGYAPGEMAAPQVPHHRKGMISGLPDLNVPPPIPAAAPDIPAPAPALPATTAPGSAAPVTAPATTPAGTAAPVNPAGGKPPATP